MSPTSYVEDMETEHKSVSQIVRDLRKNNGLTQPELARIAGVGYRFIRELENGKATLRMDKVNQVLFMFGYELVARRRRSEADESHDTGSL